MVVPRHWSIDSAAFGEEVTARTVWELEQRINFGIGPPPIPRDVLRAYWDAIA